MDGVQSLDQWLSSRPSMLRRAARIGLVRGVLLFALGFRADVVVTSNPHPGARVLLLLSALAKRRNVVLLEYIVHRPAAGLLRAVLWRLRCWSTARAVAWMQVLSESDRQEYPGLLGVAGERVELIRWPDYTEQRQLAPARTGGRVFVSGRRVDWPTVFAAARGAGWDLSVVCAASDATLVRKLNQHNDTDATIAVEVSQDEHLELLAQAAVYIIAVPETGSSIGQIRVMNAVDAGVAVVASDVVGLRGYLSAATAALVPVGDARAMRTAVDELLKNPARRDELRQAARAAASTDMDAYLHQISRRLHHGGFVEG